MKQYSWHTETWEQVQEEEHVWIIQAFPETTEMFFKSKNNKRQGASSSAKFWGHSEQIALPRETNLNHIWQQEETQLGLTAPEPRSPGARFAQTEKT